MPSVFSLLWGGKFALSTALCPVLHSGHHLSVLDITEYDLYKSVTAYINQFLPQGSGRRQASVAQGQSLRGSSIAH
jgi:hypothetical protein